MEILGDAGNRTRGEKVKMVGARRAAPIVGRSISEVHESEIQQMAKKRTVLRSSAGKKLYAKRDAVGKFEDIQTYKRAQAQDMKRTSKAEIAAKTAPTSKMAAAASPTIAKPAVPKKPKMLAKSKLAPVAMAAPMVAAATKSAPKTGAKKPVKKMGKR